MGAAGNVVFIILYVTRRVFRPGALRMLRSLPHWRRKDEQILEISLEDWGATQRALPGRRDAFVPPL
jgi:hypothetical protein